MAQICWQPSARNPRKALPLKLSRRRSALLFGLNDLELASSQVVAPLGWLLWCAAGAVHVSWVAVMRPKKGGFLGTGLGGWGVGLCAAGQGHEVAVGSPGGVEFIGPFFELLAQVEDELFELGDPGP